MSRQDAQSPVSYPINVTRLPAKGMPIWLEADERQRRELARLHQIDSVESFRFDLTLSRWQGEGIRVAGRVKALIGQTCIVSLEPMQSAIDEEVTALLVPSHSRLLRPVDGDSGELMIDAEGPDMPEPFEGDEVDAGALAEEFFALAIDPYPRREGVEIEAGGAARDDEPSRGPLYDQLRALARKD